MRLDAATRIIQYIGRDQETWNALLRSFPEPSYRVQQFSLPAGRCQDSVPSWRCECVLVIDQVEEPEAAKFMEELSRHDAGVPVIALVDSEHPARLTAAGLARLHGVHRLVVKPWPDASALVAAIESAFDWLEHWKKYLRQPLPLSCEPVETLRNAAPTFSLRPEPTVTSAASTASF